MIDRSRETADSPSGAKGWARPTIAIIGAGASGTLVAVHLLRRAQADIRVLLVDRSAHGLGIAYSTTDPRHLLNVPACEMSAFDADPDDLLRWCRQRGIAVNGTDFLPRALFGEYLSGLLARFGDRDRLELISGEATAVEPAPKHDVIRIELADGRVLVADRSILAVGNSPPTPLAAVAPRTPYIPDPWARDALARAAQARKIVIVGSGLTTVDVALSVSAINPEIEVHAISRHGWLPRAHTREPARNRTADLPNDCGGGLSALGSSIAAAVSAQPSAWRSIVDGLRPRTNELWQQLSIQDRRVFMRELKTLWDVHRHRMAPAVGDELERLQQSGRFTVDPGSFERAYAVGTGVRVELRTPSGIRRLDGDVLINATGPSSQVGESADLLTRRLIAAGDAHPDALGLGFACDADGRLLSRDPTSAARLFTLGPPRRGELLETTAIPEIRTQADALSRMLLPSTLTHDDSNHAPAAIGQRDALRSHQR
jgi:uncharacterized NAD(P)/FAD-binding protein YdhS